MYANNNTNEYPANLEQSEVKINKRNPKGLKIFAIALLLIATLGSVGYSVYAWQQNASLVSALSLRESDNKKLIENNTALKKALDADNQQEAIKSDEELAQKAAQDFVDAKVLDMKYVATPVIIKGNFASSGVAPSTQPGHVVNGLLLKKVNGNWLVIHEGQNGPDQDTITRFAVPEEFRS